MQRTFLPATLLNGFGLAACGQSGSPVELYGTIVPPIPTLNPESVAQGRELYAAHCTACHGANLERQPDWKVPDADGNLLAPPHDSGGHTWHHADDQLVEIIRAGGSSYGGLMPAFGDRLNVEEIEAVLNYIKSHWRLEERESQWWITSNRQ